MFDTGTGTGTKARVKPEARVDTCVRTNIFYAIWAFLQSQKCF
jgi:hypothetical protein